jgi:hypothetical protein
VPQSKVVEELVLGKDEAKNSAECLGLTWVDPIRIKSAGGAKSSRTIQVRAFPEPFSGT